MLFLTTSRARRRLDWLRKRRGGRSGHATPSELVAALEEFAQRDDWPSDLTFRVGLVVDELTQNVVDYAYANGDGDVEVMVMSEPDTVTIEIVDTGTPFDPLTEAPAPDLTSAIEDRPIGGLGVHFAKEMMDDICYSRDSQKNRLRIVTRKRRSE